LISQGQDPDTPRNQQYIATSRYPREDAQELSASDKKIITKAEDELPALDATINNVKRARELNDEAYTGFGASARGAIGSKLPDGMVPDFVASKKRSEATAEWDQLMSQEAIKMMSDTLKGASTDFEMKKFLNIAADTSQPAKVRDKAMERFLALAEDEKNLRVRRVNDMRGGTYFKPNSGKPITKEEYEKLPRGSKYTAPDGSERTKQ
jgi:hypothetical protein